MREPIIMLVFSQIWGFWLLRIFVRSLTDPQWFERQYQRRRGFALKWAPWTIEEDDELGGAVYRQKKYRFRSAFLFLLMFAFYAYATIDCVKRLIQ